MNNPLTMIIVVLVLVLGAGGALVFYANSIEPPVEPREEVIDDDRFPG